MYLELIRKIIYCLASIEIIFGLTLTIILVFSEIFENNIIKKISLIIFLVNLIIIIITYCFFEIINYTFIIFNM
jgi:hypothetical protein